MLLDSFYAELEKIAAAGGRLDLGSIHRSNLEKQRKDLEGSMKASAFPKGIGVGAVAGAALPAMMNAGTALNDMDAIGKNVEVKRLTSVFEKALQGSEELSKDLTEKQIKARAGLAAKFYLDMPSAIRNNSGEYVLRRIRDVYDDLPGWVSSDRNIQSPLLGQPEFRTPEGLPVFRMSEGLEHNKLIREMNDTSARELAEQVVERWKQNPFILDERAHQIKGVSPQSGLHKYERQVQDSILEAVRDAIVTRPEGPMGASMEDTLKFRSIPTRSLADSASLMAERHYRPPLEPYKRPAPIGETIPYGEDMVGLIRRIQDAQGKVEMPSIVNFSRIEGKEGFGGATAPAAMAEVKKNGFAAVIAFANKHIATIKQRGI